MLDPCPSCRQTFQTLAEAASHVCPGGGPVTDGEIDLVEEASKAALAARRQIIPTKEHLLRDCISAVQQLEAFWDGEVEVIVALVPRGQMEISYVTSILDPEKLYRVLKRLLRDSTKLAPLNPKIKS